MEFLTARIIVVQKFSVLIIAFCVMVVCTPVNSYADNPEKTTPQKEQPEESSGDSITAPVPLHQKLKDPDYDTRYERGSIHPWHDTKSIYLRRTIPLSQLAVLPRRQGMLPLNKLS